MENASTPEGYGSDSILAAVRQPVNRCHVLASLSGLLICWGPGCSSQAQTSVVLSPEQFGAVGDGRADDAPALALAISRLRSSNGGVLVGRRGAIYRVGDSITLDGLSNAQLRGNGAVIFRYTSGTASQALALYGCTNVMIEGWSFDSSYNGYRDGSTGSNPNLFLGVRAGRANRGIVIRGNQFRNGNHANITVGTTGIDRLLHQWGFANENIRIENNSLGNAGVGVFIYKGVRGFRVVGNHGSHFSNSALGIDTHAATDPDTQRYRIENGTVRGNFFRNVVAARLPKVVAAKVPGRPAAYAARGIVVKGGVRNVVIADNLISGVTSITNVETYGLLVTPDQARSPASPSRISIVNNSIEDVRAEGALATAAWALSVGPGATNITISDNVFSRAERGVMLSGASSWQFLSNRLESLGLAGVAPLEVRPGHLSAADKRIQGNIFLRGTSVALVAMQLPRGSAVRGHNEFVDFAKPVAGGDEAER